MRDDRITHLLVRDTLVGDKDSVGEGVPDIGRLYPEKMKLDTDGETSLVIKKYFYTTNVQITFLCRDRNHGKHRSPPHKKEACWEIKSITPFFASLAILETQQGEARRHKLATTLLVNRF